MGRVSGGCQRRNRPLFDRHRAQPVKRVSAVDQVVFGFFRQRDFAAFRAIADRFLAESLRARASPPLSPPSLPSATAAGFLPLSGCSAGRSPDMASIIFDAI